MNLLLLLSALLSALGGVGQAVRGSREPAAVCASAAVVRSVAIVAISPGQRPIQVLPRLAELPVLVLAVFRIATAEPLFASRRRE